MYRLVVIIPLVVGLFGCAGLPIGPVAAPDRDICHLLTTSEVSRLWGWPDLETRPGQSQRGPTCSYSEPEGDTAVGLALSPVAAIPCDQLRTSPNSTAIEGVGEWAYWSQDRQLMYVKKGAECLEVNGGPVGDPEIDYMTNLTELARIAAGRL